MAKKSQKKLLVVGGLAAAAGAFWWFTQRQQSPAAGVPTPVVGRPPSPPGVVGPAVPGWPGVGDARTAVPAPRPGVRPTVPPPPAGWRPIVRPNVPVAPRPIAPRRPGAPRPIVTRPPGRIDLRGLGGSMISEDGGSLDEFGATPEPQLLL